MSASLFDLTGRVALVTGGGAGIGRATAAALLASGATVLLTDIDADAAGATARELEPAVTRCTAARLDVTDRKAAAALAAEVRGRFGGLDILVNNAGINTAHRVPIHEFLDDEWDRLLAVDLDGVFAVSKAMIPLMIARGGGRIINMSSVLGLVPARLQSPFVAGKAAVVNLTRSMALELAPHGILVNAVAPGPVATESWKSAFQKPGGFASDRIQSLLSHIALGRPGEPEEIAAAVVFFAAPASSFVTGTVLPVDGGWTSGYLRDW